MVKNKIKDLTEEQLAIVLTHDSGKERCYIGSTLKEFIDGVGFSEDATLSELYEEICHFNLKWPFRTLNVTVEVALSQGFTIPVLEETLDAYVKGEIGIDDVDPDFTLKDAEEKTLEVVMTDGYHNFDYAVDDDWGRTLVDWD